MKHTLLELVDFGDIIDGHPLHIVVEPLEQILKLTEVKTVEGVFALSERVLF